MREQRAGGSDLVPRKECSASEELKRGKVPAHAQLNDRHLVHLSLSSHSRRSQQRSLERDKRARGGGKMPARNRSHKRRSQIVLLFENLLFVNFRNFYVIHQIQLNK